MCCFHKKYPLSPFYNKKYTCNFLKKQLQLFPEPVASSMEEAESFLEDCMAVVLNSIQEVQEFLEEEGMDVDGMTLEEIEDYWTKRK